MSYDAPEKLKLFQKKHNLPFTLISDRDKSISKLYGSKGLFFPKRKTIIINPKGIVEHVFDKVNIDSHPSDIMKFIKVQPGKNENSQ